MRTVRWASLALLVALVGIGPGASRASEQSTPRIVAVGDVHGSPEAFSRLLRSAALIDASGAWIGGDAVLVQTGDLTDRGPGVRAVLDLMKELEVEAAKSGGQVVALLGNHEVFNLIGYYDYQSTPAPVFAKIAAAFETEKSQKTRSKAQREWANWVRRYPGCGVTLGQGGSQPRLMTKDDWTARTPLGFIEYQEALSPRGEYGAWLRERPIVVRLGDTLFLHGGLSPELLEMGYTSLESINAKAAADLKQFDRDLEWLESQDVIWHYATLNEVTCAVNYEVQALAQRKLDARAQARKALFEEVRDRLPNSESWLLLDPRGPVWFRGYAMWSEETAESKLPAVLKTFGGKRVVVGHTPQPGAITARFDNQVFLVDTAMAYPELEGRAMAIEFRGDEISAISEEGRVDLSSMTPGPDSEYTSRLPTGREPGSPSLIAGVATGHEPSPSRGADERQPEADPGEDEEPRLESGDPGSTFSAERGWLAADGRPLPFADEDAVLDFLREASVLEKRTIRKGITQAQKLLLERDGLRAHAVFHDVHEEEQRHKERNRIIMNFRDSYRNNVAAWELGRLLGLTNLPPAAARRIAGREGSVQLWIENAYDEADRRERTPRTAMPAHQLRRIADMRVFDNLINNIDRNQGNMLYDPRGELWMIDHTRAFSASKKLPNPEQIRRCSRSLLAAIRALDEEATKTILKKYLRPSEVKSLFERRKAVLKILDEKIAAKGEAATLFSYEDLEDPIAAPYDESEDPPAPESESAESAG